MDNSLIKSICYLLVSSIICLNYCKSKQFVHCVCSMAVIDKVTGFLLLISTLFIIGILGKWREKRVSWFLLLLGVLSLLISSCLAAQDGMKQ